MITSSGRATCASHSPARRSVIWPPSKGVRNASASAQAQAAAPNTASATAAARRHTTRSVTSGRLAAMASAGTAASAKRPCCESPSNGSSGR